MTDNLNLEQPQPAPTRRAFFKRLVQVCGALWATGIAAGAYSYLRLPRRLQPLADQAVHVELLDELPPGASRFVTGSHSPFWLIRTTAGKLVALPGICTHRRCILEWSDEGLVCPCHGGRFDLNGNVLSGPPPRPLIPLTVTVKGGEIYVYI